MNDKEKQKQIELMLKGENNLLQQLLLSELMRLNDNLEGNPSTKDYYQEVLKRIEATKKSNKEANKKKRQSKIPPSK